MKVIEFLNALSFIKDRHLYESELQKKEMQKYAH